MKRCRNSGGRAVNCAAERLREPPLISAGRVHYAPHNDLPDSIGPPPDRGPERPSKRQRGREGTLPLQPFTANSLLPDTLAHTLLWFTFNH